MIFVNNSDLGHAFDRNMKIMSIHECKGSDSLVVRWQLTDQAYLQRNLENPFLYNCQIASFLNSKLFLYFTSSRDELCNSYTMSCPPVRGDNQRALASGLSYVQVDKHGITILYHLQSVDLAHREIFRAKVGKGGINIFHLYVVAFIVIIS